MHLFSTCTQTGHFYVTDGSSMVILHNFHSKLWEIFKENQKYFDKFLNEIKGPVFFNSSKQFHIVIEMK